MQKRKIKSITQIAVMVAIIVICSWIYVPIFQVPYTLQTLAIFLSLFLLGGRKGTIAILVYVLSGISGIPVFAGFIGGLAGLLSPTGGFVIGFILIGLSYYFFEKFLPEKVFEKGIYKFLICTTGLLLCYFIGVTWFMIYCGNDTTITVTGAIKVCIIPFIPADFIKMLLAYLISKRVKKYIF